MFLKSVICVCLIAAIASSVTTNAKAAAKQCVRQNNTGADLRDQHRMLAARDAYRSCVAEHECPAIIRSECEAALVDLTNAIPTLLVAVLDDNGHDVPGAELLVDGQKVALDGSALEVDPGPHELVAKSAALTRRLMLMAIEKDAKRRVDIVLAAPKRVERPAPALEPVVGARRSKVPAYVLGGVAALGAASFGYFALSGHADLQDLDKCKPHCPTNDVKDVRREYLFADVSLGVSIAALAAAGVFWFTSGKEASPTSSPSRPSQARISLDVAGGREGIGVSVRLLE